MDYLPFLTSVTVVCLALLWSGTDAAQLNDYILDYQPLQFNPLHLHDKHSRVKRSIDPYLRWNFKAYGRTFNVRLSPATSIFAPDHKVDLGGGQLEEVDTSFIYEGQLTDDPKSQVHMSILNDSILGTIHIPGHNTYHIEPALNHFKDPQYPSIIYPESRMNLDPYRHKRYAAIRENGACASSAIFERLREMSQPVDTSSKRRKKREAFSENFPHNKYSAHYNTEVLSRRRRDTGLEGNKTSCFLNLQVDGILHKHIYDKQGQDEQKTKDEIVAMFAIHVNAIKDIYSSTRFELRNNPSVAFGGVTFQLQKSTIMPRDCSGDTNAHYCTNDLDVSNFLDLTSLEDHSAFCLVHTFTYRDFIGGTLGLAWVATPESSNAGVCGKHSRVRDGSVVREKSLNTGITTLINFSKDVPSKVSQLTFAHEVGHNFGANHDTTAQCAPYGTNQANAQDGNYIMFPSANQGDLPNNEKFSVCSRDDIAQVLQTMVDGPRDYCFEASNAAFCGNDVVEGSEQCDCGYARDCNDECCTGRPDDGSDSDEMCKRPSDKVCSPSEGVCCTSTCTFVGPGQQCRNATDCAEASNCISDDAKCPNSVSKPDNVTFCNSYNGVCKSGECVGSICEKIGWKECSKTSDDDASEELCYVACQQPGSTDCISSNDVAALDQNPDFKNLLQEIVNGKGVSGSDLGVRKPAGSRCNFNKGYCDIKFKCRLIDSEGPFKQLADMIFNPVTLNRISNWIEDHWWAVLLMAVGAVLLMALFIKVFGYNTPSEDPSRKTVNAPVRNARSDARAQGPKADKRSRVPERAGVYATDVPMYDRRSYGGNSGQYNHGYDGQEGAPAYPQYGGPPSYQGSRSSRHQQFDRISMPPKYK